MEDGLGKSPAGPLGPPVASLPQPAVIETGEAGPPGKMSSSKLPKGTDGSMIPVQGFAGAPGESHPHVHALSSACFPGLFHASHFFVLFYQPPQSNLLTR